MSGWDARISRFDEPEHGLLSISFRAEGRNEALLVSTLPGALSLGVVDRRPLGASAGASTTKLRRHIEGAQIEAVERNERAIRLLLARGGKRRFMVAAPRKPYGAWWLCESNGEIVLRSPGAPAWAPAEDAQLSPVSLQEARGLGTEVLRAHRSARKRQLERLLQSQIRRLSKKRDAIRADLERAAKAEELRQRATLILAHANEIAPNSKYFDTMSWDEDPRPIRLELDPSKSPIELAEELFRKSKRLERGLDVAPRWLRMVEAQLTELTRVRNEAADRSPYELATELEALGVSATEPQERARRRRQHGTRLPYREFEVADATTVLVGRGAAENDRLTLRVARPHDLWLHARAVTGAHVVVRLAKGKSCPPNALVDAAMLAAHFSELRNERVADVIYTPRRFVHKRKGSPVGSVTVEREKVIAVRVEASRLERLLSAERKPA